jgi:hypothetical protein
MVKTRVSEHRWNVRRISSFLGLILPNRLNAATQKPIAPDSSKIITVESKIVKTPEYHFTRENKRYDIGIGRLTSILTHGPGGDL